MKESNISWLLDYFRGKNTGKDESAVADLFSDDSKTNELKDLLSKQFYQLMSEKEAPEKDLDHILYRIHYNINTSGKKEKESRNKSILKWSYRIAVMIALPILIYLGVRNLSDYKELDSSYAEIHAPAWTRTNFVLPDGSSVWLNSNSTIKYKINFKNERKVELTGEAFFDVLKDPKKPFTVNTENLTVKVHGTKFNVASWQNENITEVVLEEGKIELAAKNSDSSFVMKPGELALFNHKERSFRKEVVESNKYVSWTEGKLVFRNDPLDVVGRRLGRWYNADVEVTGAFKGNFGLRATFVDESLEEILDILRDNFKIKYAIQDQGIGPDGTYGKRKVKLIYEE
ncbi:MAG TPA: FecR domain-containing protein [Bacteroidales bacterium]|nr:FecR domain-containing protein [Bacteroidales bacterium]